MSGENDAPAANGPTHLQSSTTASQSQAESPEAGDNPVPKCWPKWRGKPVYAGNKDVMGWTLVSIAMLINYVGVGAFLVTTILRLAEVAVQCHAKHANLDNVNEVCGPQITLVKPSSLLTFYAMIVGVVAATILPIVGAIVDYTRHRLVSGRIAAALLTILLCPLMFLDKFNYIAILACHGCSIFVGWFGTGFYFAYLPEFTMNELQLANWTKCITIWTYFGTMVYLGGVIILFRLLGKMGDGIFLTRLGMGIMFGVNLIFLQFSWWFLFGKREALHKMPENSSLCTVGFKQLYNTGHHIMRNYRSLKWYLLHINMANAGWQAFGIIALTYMTDYLKMTALQSAIAIIVSFVGSFPGAIVATVLARRLDPLKATLINTVLMIVCVTAFVFVLTEPGQITRTYIYFLFVGINNGMKLNLDRLVSASLIPVGQEAEMMGLWLFADQCLLWLPLLVFTLLNEAGVNTRGNVVVLNVYLCLSVFYLCMAGSYAGARAEVNRTSIYSAKGLQDLAKTQDDIKNNAGAFEGAKDDVVEDNKDNHLPTAQADEIAEA